MTWSTRASDRVGILQSELIARNALGKIDGRGGSNLQCLKTSDVLHFSTLQMDIQATVISLSLLSRLTLALEAS